MDPEIASVYNHMLIPNQFHWPANVIADGAVPEPEPEPLPVRAPAPGANQLGPAGPDRSGLAEGGRRLALKLTLSCTNLTGKPTK